MKNDNENKGLPKDIDLLIQIAKSVVNEANKNNSTTKRIEHLGKLADSVNSDYQNIMSNSI